MPTETSYVGPQLIPVPSAGVDSKLRDLTLVGLLDFAGFLIKEALDAKVSEMGGPVNSAPIPDACPAAHRFPWYHNNTFTRPHPSVSTTASVLPGLWAWRTSSRFSEELSTLYEDKLESEVHLEYVFPAISIPDGVDGRSGLQAVVVAQLARYFRTRSTRHPSYGYDGDAAGTPLFRSLNIEQAAFVSATHSQKLIVPTGSTAGAAGRALNEGHHQRFFPTVELVLRVIEPMENVQPSLPGDLLNDSPFAMDVGLASGDVTEFGNGVLVRPIDIFDPDP